VSDLEVAREKAEKLGRNLLITGGVLVAGFLLVNVITGTGKATKSEKKKAGVINSVQTGITRRIIQGLAKEMALFLLGIAKNKLMEYLKENRNEDRGGKTIYN
jgi:hypothetical protein